MVKQAKLESHTITLRYKFGHQVPSTDTQAVWSDDKYVKTVLQLIIGL